MKKVLLLILCVGAGATVYLLTDTWQQLSQLELPEPTNATLQQSDNAPVADTLAAANDEGVSEPQGLASESVQDPAFAAVTEPRTSAVAAVGSSLPTKKRAVEDQGSDAAAEQLRAQQYAQFVDSHFLQEDVDPSWSTSTTEQLQQLFSREELASSALQSSECRSTLCKLEIHQQAGADPQQFQTVLVEELVNTLPRGTLYVDPANPDKITVFLAKKGHAFPTYTTEQAM